MLYISTSEWWLGTAFAGQNIQFSFLWRFSYFLARFQLKKQAKKRQKGAKIPYSQMLVHTQMLV